MLFKDNFYTVIASNQEEETITFSIQLNAGHTIFDGHFPGNPVTPGVVQMEIVKELVSEHLQQELRLQTMGNCKFLAILNPENDAAVDVILKISETEEKNMKVNAVIQNTGTIFLKMSALYSLN